MCNGMRTNPHPATLATLALSFDGGAMEDNDRQLLQCAQHWEWHMMMMIHDDDADADDT